jgi:hypothetical protein
MRTILLFLYSLDMTSRNLVETRPQKMPSHYNKSLRQTFVSVGDNQIRKIICYFFISPKYRVDYLMGYLMQLLLLHLILCFRCRSNFYKLLLLTLLRLRLLLLHLLLFIASVIVVAAATVIVVAAASVDVLLFLLLL